MTDTKLWWQSRTIWAQIVALAFLLASAFHVLPTGLSQDQVTDAIVAVVPLVTIALRVRTTATIAASPASAVVKSHPIALLVPLAILLAMTSACSPPSSAGAVVATASTDLTKAQADYAEAKAWADLFVPMLPADKAAAVIRAETIAEQALAAAQIAVTAAEQLAAIRQVQAATATITASSAAPAR